MVLVSSKVLVQVHAVVQVVIAGYLIKNPEVVTNSDLVFMMGEALGIDLPSVSNLPQSPFVFCAVFLFAEALFDLFLLSALPYHEALDEALPFIRPMRNGNLPSEDLKVLESLPMYITKSLTMYWNVWISIAGCRFALYCALSVFIYSSRGSLMASSYTSAAAMTGFDRLKNRVVFTYGFMEMMTWFWVFVTLREERQERLTKLLEDAKDN